MINFRRLNDEDLPQLFGTTVEAFSDYLVPYHPTFDGLQRKFIIENVKLELSVGAFDAAKMVGFTINGVGDWNGKITCYDAGTGVVPLRRKQGIADGMFDFLLPFLRENRIEQYLLEVIEENTPAVKLYQSLGFEIVRRFYVFKRDERIFVAENQSTNVEIKPIESPDWNALESIGDYQPSWQNSIDSMRRGFADERVSRICLGAYSDGKLIGYGIVFHTSGNVSQIAVAEKHRRRGIGRALLNALQSHIEKPLFVSNVDERAVEMRAFLIANGFSLLTTQYEMLLKL